MFAKTTFRSDGTQKSALARHIRSADDKKAHGVSQLDVIPYTGNFIKERMA